MTQLLTLRGLASKCVRPSYRKQPVTIMTHDVSNTYFRPDNFTFRIISQQVEACLKILAKDASFRFMHLFSSVHYLFIYVFIIDLLTYL